MGEDQATARPAAPHWWTAAIAAVGGLFAVIPAAVLDARSKDGLTPSAYHSLEGALASVWAVANETGYLYLASLLVVVPVVWIKRKSVAGAALAASVLIFIVGVARVLNLVGLGWQTAMWVAGVCALAPAAIFKVTTKQQASPEGRTYLLALLTFAAIAPLEQYLVRWHADFAVEPIAWLQSVNPYVLLWGLYLATAAPAIGSAAGWRAKTATGVFLFTIVALTTPTLSTASAAGEPVALGAVVNGPQHIILLTADTLRADAVEPYDAAQRTPSLRALAQDSTVFRNAFTPAPWTLPSVTSMLTGQSPEVHGVGLGLEDAALPTLSEYLSDNGYRTSAFIGNPILIPGAAVSDSRNQPRFEFYRGMHQWRVFESNRLGRSLGALHLYGRDPDRHLTGGTTADQTEYVIDWLEGNSTAPFFLWAHYYDPHWPFAPPTEFLPEGIEPPAGRDKRILDAPEVRAGLHTMSPEEQKWLKTLYSAEVRYVDRAIGQVLDKLVELGLYDDALIVFTSDHGEEFWEHRRYGHGHAIYPEVLRVPFMVKQPRRASSPKTVDPFVSAGALTPTILDLAGVKHDSPKGWPASLAPLVRGERTDFPHPVFSSAVEMFENQESVIFEGMQLIRHIDTVGVELYDLESDPVASHNLAALRPEMVERGEQLLDDQRQQASEIRRSLGLGLESGAKWDSETLQRLRDLGYL